MKDITKMSRLTGELEKAFRLLNTDFFEGVLPTPIITIIPTPRAYAHYVPFDIWNGKEAGQREINIGSGTLDRPLENIFASLLHEMTHMYNDVILNEQDTSGSSNAYHNSIFKREAEAHGLTVTRSDRYGWSTTAPGDDLIEWLLEHDEFKEIEICRNGANFTPASTGIHTNSSGDIPKVGTSTLSHTIKYQCPRCLNSCRATKKINIACLDCGVKMIPV